MKILLENAVLDLISVVLISFPFTVFILVANIIVVHAMCVCVCVSMFCMKKKIS